jgi:hypothetical protein
MPSAYCVVSSLNVNNDVDLITGVKKVWGHKVDNQVDASKFYIWNNAAQYCFPGGGFDPGKGDGTFAGTALREYKEETGFDLGAYLTQRNVAIPAATQLTDADRNVFYGLFLRLPAATFSDVLNRSRQLQNVADDEFGSVVQILKSNASTAFGPTVTLDLRQRGQPQVTELKPALMPRSAPADIQTLLTPGFGGQAIPSSPTIAQALKKRLDSPGDWFVLLAGRA